MLHGRGDSPRRANATCATAMTTAVSTTPHLHHPTPLHACTIRLSVASHTCPHGASGRGPGRSDESRGEGKGVLAKCVNAGIWNREVCPLEVEAAMRPLTGAVTRGACAPSPWDFQGMGRCRSRAAKRLACTAPAALWLVVAMLPGVDVFELSLSAKFNLLRTVTPRHGRMHGAKPVAHVRGSGRCVHTSTQVLASSTERWEEEHQESVPPAEIELQLSPDAGWPRRRKRLSDRLRMPQLDELWVPFAAGDRHTIAPPERSKSSLWLRNILTIYSSHTLQRIWSHLASITIAASLVWLHSVCCPATSAWLVRGFTPQSLHALVGGALGLLLVFRTNSAYNRFWESQNIWSTMITTIRQFSRTAHASLSGWDREHALQLLAAFPPILLQHLRSGRARGSEDQRAALLAVLPARDVDIIWRSRHRPLTVVRMLAAIAKVGLSDVTRVLCRTRDAYDDSPGDRGRELTPLQVNMIMSDIKSSRKTCDEAVSSLTATISNCERIVKTSVPEAYSKHTSRFLSVWCFTLPLALVSPLGWRMIPCVAITSWALLAIEEVGNTIEDPFNMPSRAGLGDELKLERSFRNIRGDVMDRSPALGGLLAHDSRTDACFSDAFLCFTDYDLGAFHSEPPLEARQGEAEQTALDTPSAL